MLIEMKKKDYATLLGTFCGVFAIIAAIGYNAPRFAMFMIFIGCFADLLDGYVARKTGEFNDFGIQLDSLNDAIVFGVAPAIIAFSTYTRDVNNTGLTEMGITPFNPLLMLIPTFILISGGIVRLAWFNVCKETEHYDGVPIPVTAVMLVILMLADYIISILFGTTWFNYIVHYSIPIVMIILAWFNTTNHIKYGKTVKKKTGWMKSLFLFTAILQFLLAIFVAFWLEELAILSLIITFIFWIIAILFIILGFRTAFQMKKE